MRTGSHRRTRRRNLADLPTPPRPLEVDIHYLRPPDDEQVFTQRLLLDREEVKVTLSRALELDSPVTVDDEVVLESGSDAVWFTFPGRWHDIGRFHRRDDTFTGLYANILTPPVLESVAADRERAVWRTTDLFLDVWLPPDGGFRVLDEDQLADAQRQGWITSAEAERARDEVRRIRRQWEAGAWPPPVVAEWTLQRALSEVGISSG